MRYTAEPIVRAKAMLGEGAIWDQRRQVLYWVDIDGHRVHIYDPASGRDEAIEVGCEVSTVVSRKRGGLMLAVQNGFAVLDLETRKTQLVARIEVAGQRLNDGKCDPAGRFWAGTLSYARTPGAARLYRLDADLTVRTMLEDVTTSNGIVWTSDHKTMYYIDTGPREVYAFDYDLPTGRISNQRMILRPEDGLGKPDGMAIDADDTLWIALWGGGAVGHWEPRTGELLDRVEVPGARQASSCALGGPKLDELYITTASSRFTEADWRKQPLAGSLFRVKVSAPGVVAAEFAG